MPINTTAVSHINSTASFNSSTSFFPNVTELQLNARRLNKTELGYLNHMLESVRAEYMPRKLESQKPLFSNCSELIRCRKEASGLGRQLWVSYMQKVGHGFMNMFNCINLLKEICFYYFTQQVQDDFLLNGNKCNERNGAEAQPSVEGSAEELQADDPGYIRRVRQSNSTR